jgi:fluoride exporter
MKTLWNYLAIGGAGFLGAISRYFVAQVCAGWFGKGFPIGTMVINLSGSFFLGWFATYASYRLMPNETLRLAVGVGFVGAYTTFSTYMYESDNLLRDGAINQALLNLVGSLVLGLIAVRAGWWLASR